MSSLDADGYCIDEPDAVGLRFGIQTPEIAPGRLTMTMPISDWVNPLTGRATVAPLMVLVDTAATTAVFGSRGARWPVTTELALDLRPRWVADGARVGEAVILAEELDVTDRRALASATLKLAGEVCGIATLAAAYVPTVGVSAQRPAESIADRANASLTQLLALGSGTVAGSGLHVHATLPQLSDPMVLNPMGHIQGGVVAAGLELAADAIFDAAAGSGSPFCTGSVRVNFLRPFAAGQSSRYIAAPVRIGSSMAVADVRAVGADGRIAAVARITGYRSAS